MTFLGLLKDMELTDKEFCKMYTAFYGEEIDNVKQLVSSKFNGEELKEFVNHCIELNKKDDVMFNQNYHCYNCHSTNIKTIKNSI